MEGPDAVAAVISQLEGFEAAAAAWEAEILPARVSGYEPAWLDDLCLAGRVLWTRLEAPKPAPDRERGPSPVRATPVTLLTRKNLPIWSALVKAGGTEDLQLSARARTVADFLTAQGASFFDDIVHGLDLPRTFVEEALGELVAAGLVNSDGFSGLRALLLPSSQRKPFAGGRRRRTALLGVEDAGRWTMIRRQPSVSEAQQRSLPRETVEQIARALLKRYGVVFWRLLAREAEWLPPWRDLLMAYRRMETRGEIRGGRFVAGFSGEQFAVPEAVGVLRSVRGAGQGRRTRMRERCRPAEPRRHPGAWCEGTCPLQQSRVVPRRRRRRCADRRRGAVLRQAFPRGGVGSEEHSRARCHRAAASARLDHPKRRGAEAQRTQRNRFDTAAARRFRDVVRLLRRLQLPRAPRASAVQQG